MFRFCISFVIVLTSCGSASHPHLLSEIDVQFQSYYSEFTEDLLYYRKTAPSRNIIIKFDKMTNKGSVAECHYVYPRHVIKVNKSYWDGASDNTRKVILYHELGHCILYRSHNNEVDSLGRPMSIMYPKIIPGSLFIYNKEYYLTELMK